ncbi:recombinase family protein [Amycolatopsis anabasis]|uniref:recombinase family protein n=1 Tax=Amycolatopsis anabasis TaxID=1840409 RepID=UPI00131B4B8B|nr:recombinase family protein [Amycolatopsis anabasis]
MRVLAGIRQSKKKELSESPTTQRKDISEWTDRVKHTIIGEAADIGVSASISPFKRKSLGPWLTEPELLAQWDILAVWKVDRVVRSLKHFYGELVPELEKLGKNVVAVTEGIDTLTSSPIEIAMRVSMAQEELKKLQDRASGSRKTLRHLARWPGGIPHFGHYAVKTVDGYKLAIDQEAYEALHTVRDLLKLGENMNYCLRWLTQEEILTAWDRHEVRMGRKPKGRIWRWRTLETMLQSRHLLGQLMYEGEVIRGDDGKPLQFGEPIFTREEWDELQTLVRKPKRQYVKRQGSSMLRDVAFCNSCGRKMYYKPETKKDVRHYYCSTPTNLPERRDCFAARYPADFLEEFVEEHFLDEYGDVEIVEVSAVRVVDHTSRLNEINESLDQLETDRYVKGRFKGEAGEQRFDRLYAQLEAERDELLAQQSQTPGLEYTHTGKTYRQLWNESAPEQRGDILRKYGVTVMVQWQKTDWDIPLSLSNHLRLDFPLVDKGAP